jgi:hypothetical protein
MKLILCLIIIVTFTGLGFAQQGKKRIDNDDFKSSDKFTAQPTESSPKTPTESTGRSEFEYNRLILSFYQWPTVIGQVGDSGPGQIIIKQCTSNGQILIGIALRDEYSRSVWACSPNNLKQILTLLQKMSTNSQFQGGMVVDDFKAQMEIKREGENVAFTFKGTQNQPDGDTAKINKYNLATFKQLITQAMAKK